MRIDVVSGDSADRGVCGQGQGLQQPALMTISCFHTFLSLFRSSFRLQIPLLKLGVSLFQPTAPLMQKHSTNGYVIMEVAESDYAG